MIIASAIGTTIASWRVAPWRLLAVARRLERFDLLEQRQRLLRTRRALGEFVLHVEDRHVRMALGDDAVLEESVAEMARRRRVQRVRRVVDGLLVARPARLRRRAEVARTPRGGYPDTARTGSLERVLSGS